MIKSEGNRKIGKFSHKVNVKVSRAEKDEIKTD